MLQVRINQLHSHVGETISLPGWLYNRRSGKSIHFLQIRDGSGFVQVVMASDSVSAEDFALAGSIGNESSLVIEGTVVKDERSALGVEIQGAKIQVIQDVKDYPIQITRDTPNVDKLLDIRHLWMRSPKARAVLKIRSEVIQAIRQFYYERDFVTFDSPIFTPNPCEGTSTLFETDYFGEPMYLSQSGQLYGEAGAMAFGKIVVFGPTFRAEKSKTRRHLTEFWMIEPEVCWTDLDGIMQLAEDNITYIVKWVLEKCRPELEAIGRDVSKLEAIKGPFPRLSYSQCQSLLQTLKRVYMKGQNAEQEAIDLPAIPGMSRTIRFPEGMSNKDIKRIGSDMLSNGLGDDLGAADETALSWQFDTPVMIHRYPAAVKAFYMKRDPDSPEHALCVDMIGTEGFGEIVGGAMREDNAEVLIAAIKKHELEMDSFKWFLDLRNFGTVPHGGFGLGLERVLMWLCNSHHIRETSPFPRTMTRMRP